MLEQLDKLHARIADLEARLKQKEAAMKDARTVTPEEYRKAKALRNGVGVRERERKPVPVEGVLDVRALTSEQYTDAFYKATGSRYHPSTKNIAYGTVPAIIPVHSSRAHQGNLTSRASRCSRRCRVPRWLPCSGTLAAPQPAAAEAACASMIES